jgi:hypothetical protein
VNGPCDLHVIGAFIFSFGLLACNRWQRLAHRVHQSDPTEALGYIGASLATPFQSICSTIFSEEASRDTGGSFTSPQYYAEYCIAKG